MTDVAPQDGFSPELGQMLFSNGGWQSFEVPAYVTDGLMVLAYLIEAQRYGDAADGMRILTTNYGEDDYSCPVFTLRTYCWCDGDRPDHQDECPPNFEMPGADLVVRWYKHVGRGASANRKVSASEWAELLPRCLGAVVSGGGSPDEDGGETTVGEEGGAGVVRTPAWAVTPGPEAAARALGVRKHTLGDPAQMALIRDDVACVLEAAGFFSLQSAARYIERPTMGLPGGVTPEHFALEGAGEDSVRKALAACIRTAREALASIESPEGDRTGAQREQLRRALPGAQEMERRNDRLRAQPRSRRGVQRRG